MPHAFPEEQSSHSLCRRRRCRHLGQSALRASTRGGGGQSTEMFKQQNVYKSNRTMANGGNTNLIIERQMEL